MFEDYAGPLMKKISEQLEMNVNDKIRKYQLTLSQARVIIFLSEKEGMIASQKELEDHLCVSHPTTVTIVRSMASKNLIDTYTDQVDKRMKMIHLTWGDKAIYSELKENADSMEKIMMLDFSDKEKKEFLQLLQRAYENTINV